MYKFVYYVTQRNIVESNIYIHVYHIYVYTIIFVIMQTGKSTETRRTTVRETDASRCHGGLIEEPPETPRTVTTLSF